MHIRKTITILAALAAIAGCGTRKYCNTVKIDGDDANTIIEKAANVVPTANQLAALDREFIAFIHFGPNTFTGKEWGSGFESSETFALETLDTDQWCKAIKDAGMKMVIFTAKHHDGYIMWQSRYTDHGIMSSKFRDGKGDVLKDLSESCRKYGLELGIYLSPADLYQIESPDGLYGNLSRPSLRTIPREVEGRPFSNKTKFKFNVDDYNEYYLNQLFELLTEYGPISEIWLDGAHPKTKGGQTYNYNAWRELIRALAPKANIFGREDLRWCGNEGGHTRDSEWNVVPYMANPDTLTWYSDMMADPLGGREQLCEGKYLHYQPAETDVSIRDGWFWRDNTHQQTRTADNVFDIYERSVGGNAILLLNLPPDNQGRFQEKDLKTLEETGRRIRETYGIDLLEGAKCPKALLDNDIDTYIKVKDGEDFVVTLPEKRWMNRIVLQEAIATVGERAERFAVDARIDGEWKEIATSTNIGHKRILRVNDMETDALRFRLLQSRAMVAISKISAHYSHWSPFYGNPFDTPELQEYDKNAWKTEGNSNVLVFGGQRRLGGIVYNPTAGKSESGIVSGVVSISDDGLSWTGVSSFEFGNLVNDPSPRYVHFHNPVGCRYLRIVSESLDPTLISLF